MFLISERSHEEDQHCGEAMESPSAPQVHQAKDKHPHCRREGCPHLQRASQASILPLHQIKDVVDRELEEGGLWELPDL